MRRVYLMADRERTDKMSDHDCKAIRIRGPYQPYTYDWVCQTCGLCMPAPMTTPLTCDGCAKGFPADRRAVGQLTELTGKVYDLLVASPDSVYHEAHKGHVFCDPCVLGLVKGLL